MAENLSENDIEETVVNKIYTQSYSSKTIIDGVVLITLKNHVGEDGDLSEVLKITDNGEVEQFPGFTIAQINRTKLYPGAIKGWHLHFKQDDIWHVSPAGHLMVGLWDIRKDSKTKGATMRIVLGGGNTQLLLVPRGVAHGSANVTKIPTELLYFVNQRFDPKNPDEKRLKWDSLGVEFWMPLKD